MGEGERYLLAAGANSPLKSFADVEALSAKRPVKFAVTGIEGTATAAAIIATQVLGIRRQLITGYRGSSDYIVAAIRGDADAVISATSTMMKFARAGQNSHSRFLCRAYRDPRCSGRHRTGQTRTRPTHR